MGMGIAVGIVEIACGLLGFFFSLIGDGGLANQTDEYRGIVLNLSFFALFIGASTCAISHELSKLKEI